MSKLIMPHCLDHSYWIKTLKFDLSMANLSSLRLIELGNVLFTMEVT